jgi:hypothetical protein
MGEVMKNTGRRTMRVDDYLAIIGTRNQDGNALSARSARATRPGVVDIGLRILYVFPVPSEALGR